MTNDIKEILQLIGSCCYYGKISEVECEKYRNYITNLQEENEIYKKIYNELLKQASKDSIWCKIILDKLQELKEEGKE